MDAPRTGLRRKIGNYATKKELAALFGISLYRLRQEMKAHEVFRELIYLKRPLKPHEWKPLVEYMYECGFEEIQ